MRELFLIASAGALGATSRYGVGLWVTKVCGSRLPYGTLTVNVVGSLLLGFIIYVAGAQMISRDLRIFLTTGFMGAFTTYSTFSYETVELFQDGQMGLAAMNVALNLVLGLGAAVLGIYIARAVVGA